MSSSQVLYQVPNDFSGHPNSYSRASRSNFIRETVCKHHGKAPNIEIELLTTIISTSTSEHSLYETNICYGLPGEALDMGGVLTLLARFAQEPYNANVM